MPGQLKEVRSRIGAVTSTQQITKAMKLVAASKLRRAQDRIVQMRPYANKLYEILGNIVSGTDASDANMSYAEQRGTVENVLMVVVTSDKGLCGSFNTNIVKETKNRIREKYAEQQAKGNITCLCIGKKGYDGLKKEPGLTFNMDHVNLMSKLKFEQAAAIAEGLMSDFTNKKYDAIEVVYGRFQNQITQVPTVEAFLPIGKIEATITKPEATEKADNQKHKPDFIYQPTKVAIIEELVPKILKTQFYRFLLDNNASEHGARMTSMSKATDNAEEILRDLKIVYNRVRQAAITTEIIEIVSGAAALKG